MGKCVILAAYKIENIKLPLEIISKGDFIICADGGLRHAAKMGVIPDVILGDFDSDNAGEYLTELLSEHKLACEGCGPEIIRLPAEKDDTDTAAAIKLGLERGYREFYILGGIGGRPDHTAANIVMLKYLADMGCRCVMLGDHSEFTMLKNGYTEIKRSRYKYLSVLAFGGDAEGVTLSGVKYPLHNFLLKNNFPLGVSNEITEDVAKISVKSGTLLIIQAEE